MSHAETRQLADLADATTLTEELSTVLAGSVGRGHGTIRGGCWSILRLPRPWSGRPGRAKSFVVGAIARGWTEPEHAVGETPRRVFGLATSQIATEVLKAEGLTASNVAAWLGAQRRLTAGPGSGERRPVESDHGWRLHVADLVVVDESAMTDTAALAAIHQHVDAAGAKLLLVGDHRQLASVGAGGGMDLLAQSGARYELAEARRFTHEWERDASLRLRTGDETVLRTYHGQGRLLDGGTTDAAEESAARAWLGDTLAGHQSLLLVDTNEQAARLSASLRAELVRLGRVEEGGVALRLQGTVAGPEMSSRRGRSRGTLPGTRATRAG